MSQNDLVIANQSFPATRADINSALQALGSTNSGATEPSTTYANMMWYDTLSNILKMRAEANDAWINVGYFDQSADAFRILNDTQVVNTSGTQKGLLGDQSTSVWQSGTGTTESLVSPAKVKASVLANASTQSTAAGAVGTYIFGRPLNVTDYSAGDTASGLYPASEKGTITNQYVNSFGTPTATVEWSDPVAVGPIRSGTWRCMSEAYGTGLNSSNYGNGWRGLWVRIS